MPEQVLNLQYTITESTNEQIHLTWDMPVDYNAGGQDVVITSFTVEVMANPDDPSAAYVADGLPTTNEYMATGLTGGVTYRFKILATNVYGDGLSSETLDVVAAQVPPIPDAPVLTYEGTYVKIAWDPPVTNNYADIDEYDVEIVTGDGVTFIEDAALCDGADATNLANSFCLVYLADLRAEPTSLVFQQLIQAKLRAHNERGWGEWSDANVDSGAGPLVETEPQTPEDWFVWRGDATDNTQIEVYWSALTAPENGDSEVLTYNVQWDQGTGEFVELVGESSSWLGLAHIEDGLDDFEGLSFEFKIRARNKWGWGAYSATKSVVCATVPARPDMVVTEIDPTEGGFKITWVAPDYRGEVVTNYTVQVWSKTDDDWVLSLETCDGEDATVVADEACIIPMSTITADFGYVLEELV